MRLLGYSRVSRVAGREHLISPELQQKRIEAFVQVKGWTVQMLPPELDVSGGRASRPILDGAISAIERGEADGVIVAQIDRLSRMQMTSALAVIERIESVGGQVVAVAENVDPTTPEGRMARNVFLSLAAMQRERNAESIAAAKERAVRHGIWPMSKVPPGYVKGGERRLTFGPDAPKVRAAFRARAAGASWRQVGAIIGDNVLPSTASKIISNRVYLGEITVGKWHNPTAHKPLISRELWEAAQIEHATPNWTGQIESLLRGIVRCAGCQRTMSWSEHAYRCLGRAKCELRARVNHESLDAIAVATLIGHMETAAVEGREPGDSEALAAKVETAEAELSAFQRASLAAGDEDLFAEGLRDRAQAVRDARNDLSAISRQSNLPVMDLATTWPSLTLEDRRHVLSSFLGVVWVWGHHDFVFIARGYEPEGLSRPGRKGPKPTPVDRAGLKGEIRVVPAGDIP